ncbi:MAG TPA: trypsin-like peptidase domain-containing protein [Nitrolancea sp.]|nr:trypsin-like peptidase domain-containing protein [Nitrolancea sp.]
MLTPSTVMVRADFPATAVSDAEYGSGTGIVMTADGYILTNAHVVDGAADVTVAASGSNRERPARFVGISPCDDLAVIKVDDVSGLKPAVFGHSSQQQVGEDVAAIGYPLGSEIGTDVTITRGIISKLDQPLDPYESLIQTDASINPGNSGGPLVNRQGQVIGINTLGVDPTVATNINFAISIDQAQTVIPDLQSGHNKLWLGMNLGPNNYADYFGTDAGLVVEAVSAKSPASSAGVQPAYLLTQLEGLDVNSKADVCKILRSHQDGDGLKVSFLNITPDATQLLQGEITIGQAASTDSVKVVDSQPLGSGDETATGTSGGSTATSSSGSATSTSGSGNVANASWDFSSDTGDWYTGDSDTGTVAISGGTYNVTFKQNNVYNVYTPSSVPTAGDQGVAADVTLKAGYAGIALRFSATSDNKWTYYDCYINTGDQYGCGYQLQDQYTAIVQPTASSAIKHGQANTLQMTVVGTTVTFSINGTQVKQFDDSHIQSGTPGLEVGSPTDSPGAASFDNVTAEYIP